MKKQWITILLGITLLAATAHAQSPSADRFQVKFEDETAAEAIMALRSDLAFERIIPEASNKVLEQRHRNAKLHLWYNAMPLEKKQAKGDNAGGAAGRSVEILAEELGRMKGVLYSKSTTFVELPNPKMQEATDVEGADGAWPARMASKREAGLTMNDPLLEKQWHYAHDEYVNIDLERAWTIETGKPNVVVAVMDGLVDYRHPDLAANMWTNEAELNGEPGVDDDGNGYIDDIYGPVFYADANFADHATHVAGTIAAVNNNGIGVCGIAGGDGSGNGARIMTFPILEAGRTAVYDCFRAYVYAADNGAVISSNSWTSGDGLDFEIVAEGINYFMAHAGEAEGSPMKGGLVVFAAANSNSQTIPGPISFTGIDRTRLVVVAALANTGIRSSFSNYGPWVDIAAPGGDYNGKGVYSCYSNARYGFMNGTSMACPHVSGVAALVLSHFGGDDMTPQKLKQILLDSSSPVDPYQAGYEYEKKLGKGILNAYLALQSEPASKPALPTEVSFIKQTSARNDEAILVMTLPADGNGHAPAYCHLYAEGREIPVCKVKTSGYKPGDRINSIVPLSSYIGAERFCISSVDRWGKESERSEIFGIEDPSDSLGMWNCYNNSHFHFYQPTAGFSDSHPQPVLNFRYHILGDASSAVEEPNGIASVSRVGNICKVVMDVKEDTPVGTYPMTITFKSLKDTTKHISYPLTYTIEKGLSDIKGPKLANEDAGKIFITSPKAKAELNLCSCIVDDHGLEIFVPDDESHGECILDSRLDVVVSNWMLTMECELSDWDLKSQLEHEPIEKDGKEAYFLFDFVINAYNSYFRTSSLTFKVYYLTDTPSGINACVDIDDAGRKSVYTITGVKTNQPVEALPAGLYIVNGRKLLKK